MDKCIPGRADVATGPPGARARVHEKKPPARTGGAEEVRETERCHPGGAGSGVSGGEVSVTVGASTASSGGPSSVETQTKAV